MVCSLAALGVGPPLLGSGYAVQCRKTDPLLDDSAFVRMSDSKQRSFNRDVYRQG
jgi:hypothetical protein